MRRVAGTGARRARNVNWSVYAAAAGSALAMASNASATIIYCGPSNNYCSSNHAPKATAETNSFLRFMTAQHTPNNPHPGAASHDIILNLSVHGPGSAVASLFGGNQIEIFDTSAFTAKKFSSGQKIGGSLLNVSGHDTHLAQQGIVKSVAVGYSPYGNFVSGIPGFIGLAVENAGTVNNKHTDYAWVRLMFTENANGVPNLLQVIDWAIQTNGSAITTPTPEPGTMPLALLAAGAAGVLALRRRRAAVKA